MASERTGIACEAIVALALEESPVSKAWAYVHQADDSAAVAVPDFRLRRRRGNATVYLQVTYAGAKPDSQRKLWRNLGELQELKTLGSRTPSVVAVTFGSAYLNYIPAIYEAGWDAALFTDAFDQRLMTMAFDVAKCDGASFEEKLEYARRKYSKKPSTRRFAEMIVTALECDKKNVELWESHRAAASAKVPAIEPRNTTVRRGLAKLLLARPPEGLLSAPLQVDSDSLHELIGLGIVSRSITGPRLSDPEAVNAVKAVGTEAALAAMRRAPIERMRGWLDVVRGFADVAAHAREWTSAWADLDEREVFQRLASAANGATPSSATFISLLELIKGVLGRQAIGAREVLLRAIEGQEQDRSTERTYRGLLGRPARLRDLETIRLGLQSVLSPGGRQAFSLLVDDVARIAVCLYRDYVKRISAEDAERATESLAGEVLATYFDVKIATYRDFDPIGDVLSRALERAGVAFRHEKRCACFAEKARDMGARLDPRATASELIVAGSATIINWLSVTDDGRDHKRKEMCGRALALRYQWEQRRFARRPRERLLLVVDGSWRGNDLAAMRRAGWDELFYPDEMDKLIKAIV